MTTVKRTSIKTLKCAECGEYTKGRQWWNRDTGYGICAKCVLWHKMNSKHDIEEFALNYGQDGYHYNL